MAFSTSGGTRNVSPVGGDIAAADLVAPFSIHAWCKPSVVASGSVVGKYTGSFDGGQYLLRMNSSRVGLFCLDASQGGHEGLSPTIVKPNVWTPVGGRMTVGFVLSAYAWGMRGTDDSVGTTNPNNGNTAVIGNRTDGSEAFTGDIGHVAMWNAALTDDEFLRLARGAYAPSIRPQSLTAYWSLDNLDELLSSASKLQASTAVNFVPGPFDAKGSIVVPLSIAAEVPTAGIGSDAATVYLNLEALVTVEVPVVYFDLQPSGTDVWEHADAATVLLDLRALGGECYSRFHFTGEGEADTRWDVADIESRWTGDAETRWSMIIEVQPGC